MSFLLSLSLILRRRMVPMVFLLWFSKLVLPGLHPVLVNYLVFVFLLQLSLLAGNVRFQAVPRKGNPTQSFDYRPISLTFALSKVFEFILNRKIWKHLNYRSYL